MVPGGVPRQGQTPTIAEKTAGAQKLAGYFNLYWDAKQGKLCWKLIKWGKRIPLPERASGGSWFERHSGWTAGNWGGRALCGSNEAGRKVLLIQENRIPRGEQ